MDGKSFITEQNKEIRTSVQEQTDANPLVQKEFNPFAQDKLELNHESELEEGHRRFSKDQHDSKKRSLKLDAAQVELELAAENEINAMDYQERRKKHEQLFADKLGALDHDYKWYKRKDTPRMKAVKKSLRAIASVMNMPIVKNDGKIDPLFVRDNVRGKYEEAIAACKDYVEHTRAKHSTGQRRRAMVEEIMKMIQDEMLTLNVIIDCAANGVFDNKDSITRIVDLYWNIPSATVTKAEWQKEGNSTDVYLVDLDEKDEDGKVKQYYVKENLKLISDDLPGYLDRRIRQVTSSKEAFDQGNEEGQEERLKEGHLNADDYTMGLSVLKLIQKKINSAEGKDKVAVKNRMLAFLGHDFDKFFKEYISYNAGMQMLEDQRENASALIEKLNSDKAKNKTIILALQATLNSNTPIKKLTPYEYLEFRIKKTKDFKGLDIKKDKDLLKALSELSRTNETALKTFFTRTLGKEEELYGQQCEQGGGVSEEEILAANNIATGRIAKKFGFANEVAGSQLRVMKFQRKGETKATEINCTVIDPAEGTEMLEIVKKAEMEKIPISYSPQAVRQLVRLQMIDTVCLQMDRHWRNFKCNYETVEDKNGNRKIVIKNLKSYDHDRSFSADSLKEAFLHPETKKPIKINGMLPSLMQKVNSNTPEYAYLTSRKIVPSGPDFLRFFKNPIANIKEEDKTFDTRGIITALSNEYYCSCSRYLAWSNRRSAKEIFSEHELDSLSEQETEDLEKYQKHDGVPGDYLIKVVGSLRKKDGSYLDGAPRPDEKGNIKKIDRIHLAEPQEKLADALVLLKKYLITDPREEGYSAFFLETKIVEEVNDLERDILDEEGDVVGRKVTRSEFVDIMRAVKCIYVTLRDYKFEDKACELEIGSILYYFKMCYQNSEDARNAFIEIDNEELQAGKEIEIEVPSMLHMDREAYDSLVQMSQSDEEIDFMIKDLNWSQKKITAFKKRIKDTIEEIDKMKDKAEDYLKSTYEDGDPRQKFFLEEADYDKIEDIKEIAWNPAVSYLGIEDPNYLCGDKDFLENVSLTPEELRKAKTETNELRKGQRQRLGEMKDDEPYHSIVDSKVTKIDEKG